MVRKIIINLLVVVFVFGCTIYRENKKISLKNIPLDFKGKDTIYYKRNTKIRVSKTDKYYGLFSYDFTDTIQSLEMAMGNSKHTPK